MQTRALKTTSFVPEGKDFCEKIVPGAGTFTKNAFPGKGVEGVTRSERRIMILVFSTVHVKFLLPQHSPEI